MTGPRMRTKTRSGSQPFRLAASFRGLEVGLLRLSLSLYPGIVIATPAVVMHPKYCKNPQTLARLILHELTHVCERQIGQNLKRGNISCPGLDAGNETGFARDGSCTP